MGLYEIVIADDHILLRQGLKKILEEWNELAVIGEAGDGLELLSLLKELHPHLIILDISMPNLRGLEAIHEIKGLYPDIKILVLTMHRDEEYLYQAMSAGAEGYLLKEDADKELFSAIDAIRDGKTYISPRFTDVITDDCAAAGLEKIKSSLESEQLTTREKEVLKLIAEGKTSRDIAALLYISARTVEHHRENIMNKLNLKKTADLIRYALHKGYI